jgi:histone acetyltransferase (RNA polymerase elongator complex component)
MLTRTLWFDQFYPDTLKVYPCIATVDDTAQVRLYHEFRRGHWQPFNDVEYAGFLREVVPHFPRDVHVNRLQRILDPDLIRYGPSKIIDRQAHADLSQCMWQRSIQQRGPADRDFSQYSIDTIRRGTQVCLQAVTGDGVLIGYARLSFCKDSVQVRDLRVLGRPHRLGEVSPDGRGAQHIGVGKAMLRRAEMLAKDSGSRVLEVATSAGAAPYFFRNGFNAQSASIWTKPLAAGGEP